MKLTFAKMSVSMSFTVIPATFQIAGNTYIHTYTHMYVHRHTYTYICCHTCIYTYVHISPFYVKIKLFDLAQLFWLKVMFR